MFHLFGLIYILGALGVIVCVLLGHFGVLYLIAALAVIVAVVVDSISLERRLKKIEDRVDKS